MGEIEILHQLVDLFETYRVPYLLTGGYAVTYYGEPRATNDIDFLIETTKENKKAIFTILGRLGPEYIYDKSSLNISKKQRTEFNIVHENTGIKIDFWITPNRDFNNQYTRRQIKKIAGKLVSLTSAEDLIITKLFWCKQVFSERHFRDCVGIWRVQKEHLDQTYLRKEAEKRRILDLLTDISK